MILSIRLIEKKVTYIYKFEQILITSKFIKSYVNYDFFEIKQCFFDL